MKKKTILSSRHPLRITHMIMRKSLEELEKRLRRGISSKRPSWKRRQKRLETSLIRKYKTSKMNYRNKYSSIRCLKTQSKNFKMHHQKSRLKRLLQVKTSTSNSRANSNLRKKKMNSMKSLILKMIISSHKRARIKSTLNNRATTFLRQKYLISCYKMTKNKHLLPVFKFRSSI